MADNPLLAKVLARFPGVTSSLTFPPESSEWTEKEIELYVGSGGFIKPKKKKPAASGDQIAAPATKPSTESALRTADQHSSQTSGAPESKNDSAESAVAGSTAGYVAETSSQPPAPPAVAKPSATPSSSASATPGAQAGDAPAQSPSVARRAPPAGPAQLAELPLTVWHDGEYWAPYASYMEDVGEKGLKLVSVLNKCERFRNIGLRKGSDLNLNMLKEKFGAGILLREFAFEFTAAPPADILSLLWVSLKLELPCSPFMPMFQTVIPDGSDIPVGKGVFGMLMLDVGTMSVLENNKIYEEVAVPLRKAFGLSKPTGAESVPKFTRLYPNRGRPFRPSQLLRTTYTIMPSDCDMYRVIFHPQMVGVCEKVNFALSASFQEEPSVAIYANLAKTASIGDCFQVRVFVEPPSQGAGVAGQTRVLYLFVAASGAASAAARCVMAVFVVYGSPPGALFSEDVAACAAPKFAALEGFAAGGQAGAPDKTIDLSQCARS